MKVAFGYGSDARVRGDNQDALGVFEVGDTVLGIVCDGVGGHTGGQQAAALAVRTVAQGLKDDTDDLQSALVDAITMANRAIYETGRKSHRLMGMSTTIVAVAIRGDIAVVAHVGDSRAYLMRDGRMTALTRDHTMVNMFVDNDLLSAEDAASHPEAHVLARSLGSERQVDVDVHQAVHLREGDAILLCTDGVHNTISDADLAVDWTRPGVAARQLLRKVAAYGGTDNASLVGFRIGGRGEPGMAFTDVPNIEESGDALTPSSSDMVHAPNLLDEPMPPALYPIEPEDEPTYHPDDPTTSIPGAPLIPQQRSATPRPVPRTPAPAPPRPEKRKGRKKGPSKAVLIAAAALVACLVILGAAFAYRMSIGSPAPQVAMEDPDAGQITVDVAGTTPEDPIEVVDPTLPVEPPTGEPRGEGGITTPVDDVRTTGGDTSINTPSNAWAFVGFPELRPNTKNKSLYANPSTNPQFRINIRKVVQGEQADCKSVEDIVADAVDESSDNASLYEDLWHCYQDRHHQALEGALPDRYAFGRKVQPHLEGSPRQPDDATVLPYWFLPATDGIERRLDLYAEHSTRKDRDALFDDVIMDSLDRDIIAAVFSQDLQAEAAYARAFRRVRDPEAGDVQNWARRVYTMRRHLDSPVGDLIEEVYPASYSRTQRLLKEATNDFEDIYRDEKEAWMAENRSRNADDFDWRGLALKQELEPEVAHALLVAAGRLDRPDGVKKEKEKEGPKKTDGEIGWNQGIPDPTKLIPQN